MVVLVYELAEYERARQECHRSADQLRTALFGPSPALFAHVAEVDAEVVAQNQQLGVLAQIFPHQHSDQTEQTTHEPVQDRQ